MDLPMVPPPPGVEPNLIDPVSRGGHGIVVNAVFLPLTVLTVVVRLLTRGIFLRYIWFDDYVMIFALLCVIAFAIVMIISVDYGLGKHIWDIPLWRHISYLRLTMVESILYICGTAGMKISIILFYLRIFPPSRVHIVCDALIIFILCYSIASIFVIIFMCQPIAKFWDVRITHGHCVNRAAAYYANAGLSIATDIMTLVIPMPLIRRLKIPLRQKIIIAFFLGMGAFVCIISVIRLFSIYRLFTQPDSTWHANTATIWSILEIYIGIILGSAPTLRPLFIRFFPSRRQLHGVSSGGSSASSSYSWLRWLSNLQRRLSRSTSIGSVGGGGEERRGSLFKPKPHIINVGRLEVGLPPLPPSPVVRESDWDMRKGGGTLGRNLRGGLSGFLIGRRKGKGRGEEVNIALEQHEDDGGGGGGDVEAGVQRNNETVRRREEWPPLGEYMLDEEMDSQSLSVNATVSGDGSGSRSGNGSCTSDNGNNNGDGSRGDDAGNNHTGGENV
ncbi:hypothetical protein GX50_07497 [[Emmonsia] crescens]|uniref:Rhodopsin domain-containing protein n=1 Tax=[Emmonsia] crescens TaxID=73230 RepID=A0A2B7Z969_9EURO|nr:hypothetical protein GX50_07497 [Emmonsia crescens]